MRSVSRVGSTVHFASQSVADKEDLVSVHTKLLAYWSSIRLALTADARIVRRATLIGSLKSPGTRAARIDKKNSVSSFDSRPMRMTAHYYLKTSRRSAHIKFF